MLTTTFIITTSTIVTDGNDAAISVQPAPLPLNISEVEGFRYRVNDVRRAVTRNAVREAQLKELRQELINSDRLKEHFEANPADLQLLQHNGALASARVHKHMAHVPDYLLTENAATRNAAKAAQKKRARGKGANHYAKKRQKHSNDPLQSFELPSALSGTSVSVVPMDPTGGKSQSRRAAWQEKHKKGKFSRKYLKKHSKAPWQF